MHISGQSLIFFSLFEQYSFEFREAVANKNGVVPIVCLIAECPSRLDDIQTSWRTNFGLSAKIHPTRFRIYFNQFNNQGPVSEFGYPVIWARLPGIETTKLIEF